MRLGVDGVGEETGLGGPSRGWWYGVVLGGWLEESRARGVAEGKRSWGGSVAGPEAWLGGYPDGR